MGAPTCEREIVRAVDAYYSARLRQFGPVFLGVDWISAESQHLRFDVLLRAIPVGADVSILDYGCGYGALADHLVQRRMTGCRYVGHDISSVMLEAAGARASALASQRLVGPDDPLPEVDYCLASGVFNVSLGTD